jgi:hypothetical protein
MCHNRISVHWDEEIGLALARGGRQPFPPVTADADAVHGCDSDKGNRLISMRYIFDPKTLDDHTPLPFLGTRRVFDPDSAGREFPFRLFSLSRDLFSLAV